MTVTHTTIEIIKRRFRDASKPKINQSQLADHMGYGRAWVSKLMNQGIKSLTDEQVEKLEEFLDVRFQSFAEKGETIPSDIVELARRAKGNQAVARIVSALIDLEPATPPSPRWVATQDMTKIGQEIIRIAFANDDKPGKVAREVLKLLA